MFVDFVNRYNRMWDSAGKKPDLRSSLITISDATATAVLFYLTKRKREVKHGTLTTIRAALKKDFQKRWGNAAQSRSSVAAGEVPGSDLPSEWSLTRLTSFLIGLADVSR